MLGMYGKRNNRPLICISFRGNISKGQENTASYYKKLLSKLLENERKNSIVPSPK